MVDVVSFLTALQAIAGTLGPIGTSVAIVAWAVVSLQQLRQGVKSVDAISSKLTTFETALNQHVAASQTVDVEHDRRLADHDAKLHEHSVILDAHERRLAGLASTEAR